MKTIVISSLILSICIVSSNAFTNVPIQCNSDVRTKTTLFGLSNVNDYFNSFNSKKNNDDEAKSNNPGQGSAYVNINDYFNSFNKPTANQDSSDKWHGNDNFGLNTYNEDNQHDNDAKSTTFFPKKPPVHMTLDEIEAYNDARLCPKMLLTQSAIQSFCYLLEECRDPHSGKVRIFYGISYVFLRFLNNVYLINFYSMSYSGFRIFLRFRVCRIIMEMGHSILLDIQLGIHYFLI